MANWLCIRAAALSGQQWIVMHCPAGIAILNIQLHELVLDGVYCGSGEGAPAFRETPAPGPSQLQALLDKIVNIIIMQLTAWESVKLGGENKSPVMSFRSK